MKLLSIPLARALWLGQMNDFNPKGRNVYSLFVPFLLDLYKFKKYPLPTDDLSDATKGIIFDSGEFRNSDNDFLNVRLTLFNFGVMAETNSSTIDSDFFLQDLLTKLHENLRIPHYDDVIRNRDYLSQLVFTTEKTLEILNPKLKTISDYLENNVFVHNKKSANYQISSIAYWPDPVNAANPFNFVFERQATIPFSENRYFSSAPLQTDKHLELLEMMEGVLGG
jgi:hypothetical protein